jgi:UDP-N-acetylglucosamine 2-epimerase
MKIVTIVGARPQFIKAAPVSLAMQHAGFNEFLVHTGQHYDVNMSQIFFKELGIPDPDTNLNVGSGTHGFQTGQMLIHLENVLIEQKPDWVLVYGDTNSTIAGALAAVKLNIPIIHVEAGLRSFNRLMPEEHNRVITDNCSKLLICPTSTAVSNLSREGIEKGVHLVGDTMYDAVLLFRMVADNHSKILGDLQLEPKKFILTTLHRPGNADDPKKLRNILRALIEIDETIIFPVHPRTRKNIYNLGSELGKALARSKIKMIEPVGYLDMLMLEQHARLIMTDSGGIQKEAYFFGIPCVTLREETEWVELVEQGCNILAGNDPQRIYEGFLTMVDTSFDIQPDFYGAGKAAELIVQLLEMESGKT